MNRLEDPSVMSAPTRPAGTFWNVPNSLTVARMGMGILIFWMIAMEWHAAALATFIAAALSDALDGYLARLLDQDTPLGRQLDPLIDKVLICGAYIYLAAIPGTGVHPWMVTAIVIRELLIQGLRSLMEGQGQAFGAKMAGKLKTLFQCLSISAVLMALSLASPPPMLLFVRDALPWTPAGLTLHSGASYLVGAMPALRREAARR